MDAPDDQSDLREYVQILWRRRWVVILVTLGFLGLTLAYCFLTTPVYQGTADLLLTPQISTTVLEAGDSNYAGPIVDVPTTTQVIESASVADQVYKTVPNAPPVNVTQVGTTNVVEVSTQSTNAHLAAKAATAYANAYIKLEQSQALSSLSSAVGILQGHLNTVQLAIANVNKELQGATGNAAEALGTQLSALQQEQLSIQTQLSNYEFAATESSGGGQVLTAATVPSSPVKPKTIEYALLAVFLGLAIGIGMAMLLEFFDDGIRTKEDLARAAGNMPMLGLIPEVVDWRDSHAQYLVSRSSPNSAPAEAYRALRTSIQFLGLDRSIKTLQFSSPSAAEGKTTTMANLGVVAAQAGLRVVMVCCDLRRPRLHEFFGLSNQVGFTSVLLGSATLEEALQTIPGIDNLHLLASGQIPPNPSELLSGARTGEVLATLAENADLVLIDSPPVLVVTDAVVLASRVDAIVVVGSVGTSTRSQVTRALQMLNQIDAPVSGIVLNRASPSEADTYYRYASGAQVSRKSS
jgi:capsular exopolysaccharide synthesis family protein